MFEMQPCDLNHRQQVQRVDWVGGTRVTASADLASERARGDVLHLKHLVTAVSPISATSAATHQNEELYPSSCASPPRSPATK